MHSRCCVRPDIRWEKTDVAPGPRYGYPLSWYFINGLSFIEPPRHGPSRVGRVVFRRRLPVGVRCACYRDCYGGGMNRTPNPDGKAGSDPPALCSSRVVVCGAQLLSLPRETLAQLGPGTSQFLSAADVAYARRGR